MLPDFAYLKVIGQMRDYARIIVKGNSWRIGRAAQKF